MGLSGKFIIQSEETGAGYRKRMVDLEKYDIIVGYGIGQNYEQTKQRLRNIIELRYLADKKWETSSLKKYDNIPIIRLEELKKLKNALVVLFPEFASVREVITREFESTEIDVCYIYDILPLEGLVTGQDLIALLPKTEYWDEFQNHIVFDKTIPANIKVHFYGEGNFLKIGKNISVEYLEIYFGNRGGCVLENDVSIQQAVCRISESALRLGEGCMLSSGIMILTHDEHHIFDSRTHNRVNCAKDVIVENQVWVGYRATLLGGTHIGTGSIVGTGTVTSSHFGDHVAIGGCPAKIIRENVCWSKDSTWYFDRTRLEECIDQSALNYM